MIAERKKEKFEKVRQFLQEDITNYRLGKETGLHAHIFAKIREEGYCPRESSLDKIIKFFEDRETKKDGYIVVKESPINLDLVDKARSQAKEFLKTLDLIASE